MEKTEKEKHAAAVTIRAHRLIHEPPKCGSISGFSCAGCLSQPRHVSCLPPVSIACFDTPMARVDLGLVLTARSIRLPMHATRLDFPLARGTLSCIWLSLVCLRLEGPGPRRRGRREGAFQPYPIHSRLGVLSKRAIWSWLPLPPAICLGPILLVPMAPLCSCRCVCVYAAVRFRLVSAGAPRSLCVSPGIKRASTVHSSRVGIISPDK